MALKRRSTEEGHRRKFLVVIDDTPECGRALLYAARRAEHSGGEVAHKGKNFRGRRRMRATRREPALTSDPGGA